MYWQHHRRSYVKMHYKTSEIRTLKKTLILIKCAEIRFEGNFKNADFRVNAEISQPWAGDPRLAHGRSRVWAPGPAGTLRALFFLHPPFLPPSGASFFRTFPSAVVGMFFPYRHVEIIGSRRRHACQHNSSFKVEWNTHRKTVKT